MLVQCDAKALEWKTLLWLSGDKVGIDEQNRGEDVHEKNKEYFGLPTRLISKKYLFRTIYRGSGWAFANDFEFKGVSADPDYWDEINKKFYTKYKGIDTCHSEWAQLVAKKKPIVSPIGREWLIPLTPLGELPWTTLTNYPVQGTGADIMAIARISLRNRLLQKPYSAKLISTVHDSIVVDVTEECVPDIAATMAAVFSDIPANIKKLWGIELPLKFPCEVKAGKNLKDMTEL